jgi:hypothetical protein
MEPYKAKQISGEIFTEKRKITGEFIALINLTLESRGLKLITPFSRAVLKNEIHEVMLTDEQDASPGKTVNRVSILGFFEVKTGGIIVVGDETLIEKTVIGEVAGFDVTHMPNHMGIIVKARKLYNTLIKPGSKITFLSEKSSNVKGLTKVKKYDSKE